MLFCIICFRLETRSIFGWISFMEIVEPEKMVYKLYDFVYITGNISNYILRLIYNYRICLFIVAVSLHSVCCVCLWVAYKFFWIFWPLLGLWLVRRASSFEPVSWRANLWRRWYCTESICCHYAKVVTLVWIGSKWLIILNLEKSIY